MDNYILMNDMVQDHEARMMHLKRYYPFFRLMDTGLSLNRDGSYVIYCPCRPAFFY